MMKPSSQWAELRVTKPHRAQGKDRGAVLHRDTQERENGPNLFPGGDSASSPGSPVTGPQRGGGGGTAGRGAAQTQTPVLVRLLAPDEQHQDNQPPSVRLSVPSSTSACLLQQLSPLVDLDQV